MKGKSRVMRPGNYPGSVYIQAPLPEYARIPGQSAPLEQPEPEYPREADRPRDRGTRPETISKQTDRTLTPLGFLGLELV